MNIWSKNESYNDPFITFTEYSSTLPILNYLDVFTGEPSTLKDINKGIKIHLQNNKSNDRYYNDFIYFVTESIENGEYKPFLTPELSLNYLDHEFSIQNLIISTNSIHLPQFTSLYQESNPTPYVIPLSFYLSKLIENYETSFSYELLNNYNCKNVSLTTLLIAIFNNSSFIDKEVIKGLGLSNFTSIYNSLKVIKNTHNDLFYKNTNAFSATLYIKLLNYLQSINIASKNEIEDLLSFPSTVNFYVSFESLSESYLKELKKRFSNLAYTPSDLFLESIKRTFTKNARLFTNNVSDIHTYYSADLSKPFNISKYFSSLEAYENFLFLKKQNKTILRIS